MILNEMTSTSPYPEMTPSKHSLFFAWMELDDVLVDPSPFPRYHAYNFIALNAQHSVLFEGFDYTSFATANM